MLEMLMFIALASTPPVAAPPQELAEPTKTAEAPLPPPLTRKALCGELTRTNKELTGARAKLESDRKALDGERKELEKLKAEIAQARAGLRLETDRLEGLLTKRGDATPPATRPTTQARPQELDALARTIKAMKPESAAALVQRTEPFLAASLLKRMKPADAGAVMDKLKPDQAADLLALMSTLPSAPTKPGGSL